LTDEEPRGSCQAGDEPRVHPLPVRDVWLAALLIAHGGRVSGNEARSLARRLGYEGQLSRKLDGRNRGSIPGRMVQQAAKRLRLEGLVHRDGADIVAEDLADLADWLADELAQADG
jgi:hypothetical protein